MKTMKILVIRFSSLGDLVLTSPVFRELKKVYPTSEITLLTSEGMGRVLENTPEIDRTIYHPRKENFTQLIQLIQSLQKYSFDVVYDIHRSLRSRIICLGLFIYAWKKKVIFWKINKRGWQRTVLIQWKINVLQPYVSQRQIFLEPLQKKSSRYITTATKLYPTKEHQEKIKQLLLENQLENQPFICIGASASFAMKCWPVERYLEVIEWLLEAQFQVVLVGGKGEQETEQLQRYFQSRVISLAGQLSALESAYLLSHARLVLCNDTSIAHLAEAMQTPTITIFGPTVKQFGYAPYLPQSVLIEKELPCRPCTRNGSGSCQIKEKYLCLRSISVDQVKQAIQQHPQFIARFQK